MEKAKIIPFKKEEPKSEKEEIVMHIENIFAGMAEKRKQYLESLVEKSASTSGEKDE